MKSTEQMKPTIEPLKKFIEKEIEHNDKLITEQHTKVDEVVWNDLTDKNEIGDYCYRNGKLDGIELVNNQLRRYITTIEEKMK